MSQQELFAGAADLVHDLVDIIDMEPVPGEYVWCKHPMEPIEVFGVTVTAWHRYHAARIVVGKKWGQRCECCRHHIRYAHVTQDQHGGYHCFGRTCLDINALGEEGARKLEYSERIEQKKAGGFCANFAVPAKFWDLPRDERPRFTRPWKGKDFSRRGRGAAKWYLSVWGDSFEECLANCLELGRRLGVKLS